MYTTIDEAPNYEVNELGEIKNKRSLKPLKPQVDKQGYRKVRLYSDKNNFKDYYVHKLVAEYFMDIPKDVDPDSYEMLVIDHVDHDLSNNQVSNLRYVLKSEHIADLHKLGTVYNNYPGHGQVQITVTDGTTIRMFESIADCGVWIHSVLKEPKPTLTSVKVMCSLLANHKISTAYGFRLATREDK